MVNAASSCWQAVFTILNTEKLQKGKIIPEFPLVVLDLLNLNLKKASTNAQNTCRLPWCGFRLLWIDGKMETGFWIMPDPLKTKCHDLSAIPGLNGQTHDWPVSSKLHRYSQRWKLSLQKFFHFSVVDVNHSCVFPPEGLAISSSEF